MSMANIIQFNLISKSFQETTVIKPAAIAVRTDADVVLKPKIASNNGIPTIGK